MSFESRFMCMCSPEGLTECEAVYDQVMLRTKARDDRDFLSSVIYSLTLDNIDIEFMADQWGGISGVKYEYVWDNDTTRITDRKVVDTVFFACDDFRHGLAAVWLYFNPETITLGTDPDQGFRLLPDDWQPGGKYYQGEEEK